MPINWLCSIWIGKKDDQITALQIFERCFDLPLKRVIAMPTEPILDESACPFAHSHSAHVPTYEVTMVDDVSLVPAAHLLRIRFPPQQQNLHDLLEVVPPTIQIMPRVATSPAHNKHVLRKFIGRPLKRKTLKRAGFRFVLTQT